MKAEPSDQRRLLDLQEVDTALNRLEHRRRSLPELTEIAELEGEIGRLRDRVAQGRAGLDDIDRDIARAEREIEQVRNRAERDRSRLSVGTGPAKELEGLQHELSSLARRQSELEDGELELMEARETAQATVEADEGGLERAEGQLNEATDRRDAALAEIAESTDRQRAERVRLVGSLPDDLVGLYEKIRETRPIAAAMLRQRRCEGCRIEMSGGVLEPIRQAAPEEVLRCEECRAILVRTEESGI